ncbi:MAG: ornithine carbamoyltransferase [Candidatus Sumerlaeaceae bacterium]|nr:ornithine carbamoyltransferase [Candidatus Sumerlaeaceae bacterium]
MKRDFLTSADFSAEKVQQLFELSAQMKADTQAKRHLDVLKGHCAAMIFQKPSLRTRMTFDIGMQQLGGTAIYLGPAEIALGVRESAHDIAKNLERWADLIVARVFAQADIEELARASRVPVINALSDDEHPCQAMADYFTLFERGLWGRDVRLAFIGDGNNTCCAVMTLGAVVGADVRVATPPGYEPPAAAVERARALAEESGGTLTVCNDPVEAVRGANAVYTDTWASMHVAHEAEQRRPKFQPYQVNRALLDKAGPGAVAMHCLPAHRNEEITDDVMDGPDSVIFDQAENRLHVQKAVILECMGLAGTR